MNCETCKYWDDYDGTPTNIKVGECTKVKMFWDSTEWGEEENEFGENLRLLKKDCETIAFVQDASDYHARLLTMAEFSCNQYKGK